MSVRKGPAAYEPTGGQINAAATALDELNWRSGSLTITTGMLAQAALAAAAEYGDLEGAPVRPGRYVVSGDGQKPLMFVEVRDVG